MVRIRYTAARTGIAHLAIPGRMVEVGDVIDVPPVRAAAYLTAHVTRDGSLVADFEPEDVETEVEGSEAEQSPEEDPVPARSRHRKGPEPSPTEPEAATIEEAPDSGGTGAVIEPGEAEADPGNENTGSAGGGN